MGNTAKCSMCGGLFTPKAVTQKYCSKKCCWRAMYLRKCGKLKEDLPERRFDCAYCGEHVIIPAGDRHDKRSRFCCKECEVKYWKHPNRNGR